MGETLGAGHMADLIEAIHRLDLETDPWLEEVRRACVPLVPWGEGVMAGLAGTAPGQPGFEIAAVTGDRDLAGLARRTSSQADEIHFQVLRTAGRAFTLLEAYAGKGRHGIHAFLDAAGLVDGLLISAVESQGPSLRQAGISVGSTKPIELSTRERHAWSASGAHLAAAWRLRLRLTEGEEAAPCEAVVAPTGGLVHAEGAARDPVAREALTRAVRNVESARLRERRSDHESLLEAWQAVYEGRWTLVEQIDTDGRRQILARVNEHRRLDRPGFSPREQEIAYLLCAGVAQKAIAYELSISPSTVGFHVHSIVSKLGARSTTEAVHLLTAP